MKEPVRLLALPSALVVGPVSGVFVLADSAREHNGVTAHIDPSLTADAIHARSGTLTHLATVLTLVGSEVVVGVLALLLVVVLLERRGPFVAGCAAMAMAVSASLTIGVKLLVARDRPGPGVRLGPADSSYSFPSGHSLNSAVFLGLVAILLVPLFLSGWQRVAASGTLILLALGIGLSRVYLGYHWASDVAASWLIATAVLALVQLATLIWAPRIAPSQPDRGQVRTPSGQDPDARIGPSQSGGSQVPGTSMHT